MARIDKPRLRSKWDGVTHFAEDFLQDVEQAGAPGTPT
jgi:hypothetical protein